MSFISSSVYAFDEFTVQDIKLQGLQHIDPGTVFAYLPVRAGEKITEERSAKIIRALYQTGFFQDVSLSKDSGVLLVSLVERPAIASIKISGNDEVSTDDLKKGFKDIGLAKGLIFNRSLLDRAELELQRQYYSRGKYGVEIKSTIKELERNRVDLSLKIDEGDVAQIKKINIVGNNDFDEEELLDDFQLGVATFFSFFSSADKYSKQKLIGDLEVLRSYYLDRGYINFSIDSTQVSISPDKKDVFITVNITEGGKFTLSDVKLGGDLIVPEEELASLITIKEGDVFSRKVTTAITTAMNERLGQDGYAFANINMIPDVDKDNKKVALTFFIDPGKRVYVRRINLKGNNKTHDEVIRRELRQLEGGWISTQKINRSRTRLQRLGYLQEVNVETTPVSGTPDQVDIDVSVKDGSSGTLMAGMGYGEASGVLFNASISERNFLGTGKRLKLQVDTSSVNTIYSLSYTNPYYTIDGVSRSLTAFSRSTDAGEANVSSYLTDVVGGKISYGFPISEFVTASLGFGVENMEIKTTFGTPLFIFAWVNLNGHEHDRVNMTASWVYDTRNRILFADEGVLQSVAIDVAIPGGDLEYFKLTYRQAWHFPLYKGISLGLRNTLAYGDGYGDTAVLPFFENYYLGGISSVRGYRANSLGPRDLLTNTPIGGNRKLQAGMDINFPSPFEDYQNNFRWSYFVDVGNVFGSFQDITSGALRASHGVSAKWITPIGALIFSLGWPINDKPGDELDSFQFTIGAPF